jgi:hypothetical protein
VNNLGELGLDVPVLGSFHASDVTFYDFGTVPDANTKNIMDTLIAFVSSLDPNNHVSILSATYNSGG